MKKTALFLAVMAVVGFSQEVIIGNEEEELAESPSPRLENRTIIDEGFHGGAVYMNTGILYGSSLAGVTFDFGLTDWLGIAVGGGYVGVEAGANWHVFSRKHLDMYVSTTAGFWPGLMQVMPEVSYNLRGFFGSGARAGVGGKIGLGMVTRDYRIRGNYYEAGKFILTYAIGVPIKIKK